MNARVIWSRRRISFVALVVVLAALAVPVSFAVAGNGSNVTAPVLYHDNTCGTSTNQKQIGTVKWSQHKGTLTVSVDLARADPGNYYLYTYYGGASCIWWGDTHKIKVDATGHAHKSYSLTGTQGYNDWVLYGYSSSSGEYDDSPPAHLSS